MNPLLDATAINAFLADFDKRTRQRGMQYFQAGAVRQLVCKVPGQTYAAIVQGSDDYEVTLEYDSYRGAWDAECTCPVGYECKHAYAAMIAFRSDPGRFTLPAGWKPTKDIIPFRLPSPANSRLPAETPQAPPSPLARALASALGRNLNSAEDNFVRRVQRLFLQTRSGHSISGAQLRQIAPEFRSSDWQALQLWRDPPRDDLEFWLYCAWELRRRKVRLPELLEPVSDLSPIEPVMRKWERGKEIDLWRATLANQSPAPEPEPVDFRLMVLHHELRVQWKLLSDSKFKDLKHSPLRRLGDEHQSGTLRVMPDAMPLWDAIFKPYQYYASLDLDYARPETLRLLDRLLRLQSMIERIVDIDGAPLSRPADPLRYELRAATSDDEDYSLSLVRADGSLSPPILAAVRGQPSLYLTERELFQGPPPHRLGARELIHIPAPALETAPGARFLQSLNLDLPPRIVRRVRRVSAVVKLTCEVKPTFEGSDTEAVYLRATAEMEGAEVEQCDVSGWRAQTMTHLSKLSSKRDRDDIIPLEDRSALAPFPRLFETLAAKWDYHHAGWRVRLTKDFPEKFIAWLDALPKDTEVYLDRELKSLRDAPVAGKVRLDLQEAGVDWFDLKVVLNVSDTDLTPEELNLLLNARGRFVRLKRKGWRRLDFDFSREEDERLARLGLNAREFSAEPQRLHALQLADPAAQAFLPEEQAKKLERRAGELKLRVTPPVPQGIHAILRPYQVEGFHFLAYLTANRFGGVLADDMGLGKTLQTLTWLSWLRDSSVEATAVDPAVNSAPKATPFPSLVVCPKSVMDNWQAEVERFFPGLSVQLWHGEDASALDKARTDAGLLVLNYAQLRSLSPDIAQHRWLAVILDEAQYIKNPDSQTARAARALQAEHRLALTGTPIENRLLDLWSIFAFAMPGVLGNRAQFLRLFNQKDDPFARRRLAARVRPFLLRRTKGQVAKDLPDRIEEDLVCEMEGEQRTLYRAEFKRAQQTLLNITTQKQLNDQRFNLLTSLLRLRQICCHPALVRDDLKNAESAKVSALLDVLEPLMDEGHKVLVFSQFVSMLEILRTTVKQREWNHFYLAGDTENRGELVRSFQNEPGAAIFLISLKAGGFGLNLTAASYVVLFDPWWNPAVEMQAIDRTHRIGQTSKVIAYRLLLKDSIEQKIRALQRSKAALAEDVLGEEKFTQSLTLNDLQFLFADPASDRT